MDSVATDHAALSETRSAGTSLSGYWAPLLIVGAVVLCIAAAIAHSSGAKAEFWHAYLMSFAFVASIVIGGLFFTIATHLFGAYWATSIRRLAEIVAGALPVIIVLFIPMAVFVLSDEQGTLYAWTFRGDAAAHTGMLGDEVLAKKADYLSPFWYVVRATIIFGVWFFAMRIMTRGSLKVDETGSVSTLRGLARWSGPLMAMFAISLNIAAFDWFMSLDPWWFSTMFGVYYWAGSFMSFLAVLMLMILFLHSRGILTQSIRVEQRHDVAKLMFAMVVFWGYVTFSQFMLIWYANVTEEIKWYADRGVLTDMGISTMTGWLFVVHLLIPFLGFMSKRVRRNPTAMAFWSVYLLAVHLYDCYYVVMPTLKITDSFTPVDANTAPPFVLMALCMIGMVAILLAGIARGTAGKFLTPVRDPRMHQALTYVNH